MFRFDPLIIASFVGNDAVIESFVVAICRRVFACGSSVRIVIRLQVLKKNALWTRLLPGSFLFRCSLGESLIIQYLLPNNIWLVVRNFFNKPSFLLYNGLNLWKYIQAGW